MKVTLTEEFLDEMADLPKSIGKRCREEIRNLLRSKGTTELNLERLTNSPSSALELGTIGSCYRLKARSAFYLE